MNTPYVPAAEAAFIGGVSAPQMNRLVDEELVPSSLLSQEAGARRFARLSAAFARFFFDTELLLVAGARKRVLAELTHRIDGLQGRDQVLALTRVPQDVDWTVTDRRLGIVVDVSGFVKDAMARAKAVDIADSLVAEDPEIMGGLPCFAGTRVPIDNVLASLDKGISVKRVFEAYPFLTEAHVDAARVYAQVHPRRGRPRRLSDSNPGALRRVSRVVRPARA